MNRLLWMLLLGALVFWGCQTAPETMPEEEHGTEIAAAGAEEEQTAEVEDSAVEAAEIGEAAAEESGADESPSEESVSEAQAEEPPAEEPPAEELQEFVVTEELYNQTFDDIEAVIAELNALIQAKDYDLWLTQLTDTYIEETSKSAYLSKWIKEPDQRDLKTYFLEVVVSTRSKVKLDEIEFIDDSSVCAYTVYKGEKYLLYYLVKTEDGWKVDFY